MDILPYFYQLLDKVGGGGDAAFIYLLNDGAADYSYVGVTY